MNVEDEIKEMITRLQKEYPCGNNVLLLADYNFLQRASFLETEDGIIKIGLYKIKPILNMELEKPLVAKYNP